MTKNSKSKGNRNRSKPERKIGSERENGEAGESKIVKIYPGVMHVVTVTSSKTKTLPYTTKYIKTSLYIQVQRL